MALQDHATHFGQVREIIQQIPSSQDPSGDNGPAVHKNGAVAIIERFHLSETRHEVYDMPYVTRRHEEEEIIFVPIAVSAT